MNGVVGRNGYNRTKGINGLTGLKRVGPQIRRAIATRITSNGQNILEVLRHIFSFIVDAAESMRQP